VLIVDDDVASVELLGHLLEDEGFEVWKAHTGTQARQRLAEQLPDLVLMDVMLPDVDGRELCRELKSAERTRNLFVILISGLAPEEITRRLVHQPLPFPSVCQNIVLKLGLSSEADLRRYAEQWTAQKN
jgi:CheY-like chemotaxis protein